jgi:DNA invertase Pin-like site-specific DNA recombinase
MPRFLAAEVKAKVRELYEGTALTHARIAAATGVGASTVSVLAQREGWTRHPEARTVARLEAGRREAILRMREACVPARAIAAAAGCHPRTVGRIASPERRAVAFGIDVSTEAGFAPVPAALRRAACGADEP